MGSASSIAAADNDSLVEELKETVALEEGSAFAIEVLEKDYARMKAHNLDLPVDPLFGDTPPPFCATPAELLERLQSLYLKAKEEEALPIEECKCPSVIMFKYESMEPDARNKYKQQIIDAFMAVENSRIAKGPTKKEDYSKSFGGTEADSKNEKEAAALLRGETVSGTHYAHYNTL